MPKLFNALTCRSRRWYALLDALDQQVPAMDTGIAINAQDQKVKPRDLDPAAKKVLADYRMIQYDLSIGKRYSEKIMFGDAPTELDVPWNRSGIRTSGGSPSASSGCPSGRGSGRAAPR